MRIAGPDDHAVLTRAIGDQERKAMELRAEGDRLRAALQEALTRDEARFQESEVWRLRRDLASVEEQAGMAADRAAALRGRLPSDDERKAAAAEAKGLVKDAEAASRRTGVAWGSYLEAMAAAEVAAGAVSAARAEVRRRLGRLADLAARFGLDIAAQSVPEAPDTKLAYLTGILLSQVALGEPEDVVVRDLATARRKLAS